MPLCGRLRCARDGPGRRPLSLLQTRSFVRHRVPFIVPCASLPQLGFRRVWTRRDEIQSDARHAFARAGVPIQIAAVFDLLESRGHALVHFQFERLESVARFDRDVRADPARRAFGDHAQKAAHLEANNVERDLEVAFRRQFRIGYAVQDPVERVKRQRAISGLESVRHALYELPFAGHRPAAG